jgi:anti-sigma factor RsiW
VSERGPFGAETPDEVLIAYVNGRLNDAERAEVERWLDEHPAWQDEHSDHHR